MYKLTFTGNVIEFGKLAQVKLYLRHHRAVSQMSYTVHHDINGMWILWDVYRNCRMD